MAPFATRAGQPGRPLCGEPRRTTHGGLPRRCGGGAAKQQEHAVYCSPTWPPMRCVGVALPEPGPTKFRTDFDRLTKRSRTERSTVPVRSRIKIRTIRGPECRFPPPSRSFPLVSSPSTLYHQQTKNLLLASVQGGRRQGWIDGPTWRLTPMTWASKGGWCWQEPFNSSAARNIAHHRRLAKPAIDQTMEPSTRGPLARSRRRLQSGPPDS
jgi:hypothetical protein